MASISPIPAEQMVAQALPAANLHGARRGDCFDVLILDDDPFDQKRLLRTLESTGLPVNTVSATTIHEFDAALNAGSFDVVLCHQALDAYGPVSFWYAAIDDMLRIARRSIGLVLNPLSLGGETEWSYLAASTGWLGALLTPPIAALTAAWLWLRGTRTRTRA